MQRQQSDRTKFTSGPEEVERALAWIASDLPRDAFQFICGAFLCRYHHHKSFLRALVQTPNEKSRGTAIRCLVLQDRSAELQHENVLRSTTLHLFCSPSS